MSLVFVIRIYVQDNEPYGNLHRGSKGEAPENTLLFRVLRITYLVLHELQRRGVVRILDGKDAVEDSLESDIRSFFRGNVPLEKLS